MAKKDLESIDLGIKKQRKFNQDQYKCQNMLIITKVLLYSNRKNKNNISFFQLEK